MKMTNPLIIVLAVALATVIGYAVYLHQVPLQNISAENQGLKNEMALLKTASEEIKAGDKSDLTAKTQLAEELHKKNIELKESIEKIRNDKETSGTDFQKTIKSLENRLTQNGREIQLTNEENQQLRTAKSDLLDKIKSLENQLLQKQLEAQTLLNDNQEQQQTIITQDGDRVTLTQKLRSLNGQLQASKDQAEVLDQERVIREEKLEKMAAERQVMVGQMSNLEDEKDNLYRETRVLKNQLEMFGVQVDSFSQEAVSKENQLRALKKSYEDLKTRLKKQIQEKTLIISTLEDKLNIRLMDKILFAPGQTVISSKGKQLLSSLAEELKKMEGIQISVEGHTDNQPLGQNIKNIYIDNLGLSTARSAAVVRTLRMLGVKPQLLSATGYSMHRPVAINAAPDGQQQNRRVEIILAPLR